MPKALKLLCLTSDYVKHIPQVALQRAQVKTKKGRIYVLSDSLSGAAVNAAVERPIIKAGDYLNKLTGEHIEYECRRKLDAGAREIVLDFGETELVNSIGISILLGIADVAAARGARIICSDVSEETIELFEMLGVTRHVTLA